MTPKEVYLHWIKEREAIRLKKKANSPKPWTRDSILQKYRFCNVRRMDDFVSDWLLKHWYQPNFNSDMMPIACTLSRHFNNIEALDLIGFPEKFLPEKMYNQLRVRKDSGKRIFNGAYIIRGNSGRDKADSVINYTVKPMVKRPPKIYRHSMQDTHKVFMEYKDIGSFMAGQIVADLRWAMKGTWKDKDTWAPLGPGSKKGLNIWFDRDPATPLSQCQFEEELKEYMAYSKERLPTELTSRLEAMDWQNTLCENSKYWRTVNGTGKPKQNYPGRE